MPKTTVPVHRVSTEQHTMQNAVCTRIACYTCKTRHQPDIVVALVSAPVCAPAEYCSIPVRRRLPNSSGHVGPGLGRPVSPD